jgi:hypothetical protein
MGVRSTARGRAWRNPSQMGRRRTQVLCVGAGLRPAPTVALGTSTGLGTNLVGSIPSGGLLRGACRYVIMTPLLRPVRVSVPKAMSGSKERSCLTLLRPSH